MQQQPKPDPRTIYRFHGTMPPPLPPAVWQETALLSISRIQKAALLSLYQSWIKRIQDEDPFKIKDSTFPPFKS